MTLVELVVVVSIVALLLTLAIPGYKAIMLRVHRGEAVRMLLKAAMCQQRVYTVDGSYDTGRCLPVTDHDRYQISFRPPGQRVGLYIAIATPIGAQLSDTCGSLTLDQNGARGISATGTSVARCWDGR